MANGIKTAENKHKSVFFAYFLRALFIVKRREKSVVKHPTKMTIYSKIKIVRLSRTINRIGISLMKLSTFLIKTKLHIIKKIKSNTAENKLDKKACFLFNFSPAFASTNTLITQFNAT